MSTTKSNGIEPSDWARAPVASGPAWQRILKAIYNPEEKSFLGRTAKRWGIVLTFYLVFYAVLAMMFAACMGGLFYSLDDKTPTYTLKESLIGANPGVCFRPRPADGALVRLNRANTSSYEGYLNELEEFLKPYSTTGWPSCMSNDSYGYPDAPCFFIKLNKIYGWEPEYYTDTSLPEDMPEDLVEFIKKTDYSEKNKQIWFSCSQEGSNSSVIEYPWGRALGEPSKYPYLNQPGYRSPVLAVRILPPASIEKPLRAEQVVWEVNTQVIIRCRLWAKNIIHNKSIKEASGYTRIMLYIEDHTSTDNAVDEN